MELFCTNLKFMYFCSQRCLPIHTIPLSACPACFKPASTIYIFPLSILDLNSRNTMSVMRSPSSPLDRKRVVDDISEHEITPNHRTGRWTSEEITFTDEIIANFDAGTLPLPNGMKLVDFLGTVLLSKPSRLTKKLKNAKLSAKCYKRTLGHVCYGNKNVVAHTDSSQIQPKSCKSSSFAASFSRLEDLFIKSLPDYSTTSEIKFTLTHNWRDWFSSMCFQLGQPLDAGDWLNSIEELDRRATMIRERALHAKRRMRMGYALQKDSTGSSVGSGVFINGMQDISTFQNKIGNYPEVSLSGGSLTTYANNTKSTPSTPSGMNDFLSPNYFSNEEEEFLLNSFASNAFCKDSSSKKMDESPVKLHSGGKYLDVVMEYIEREHLPFQYMDVWVPSFVANEKTNSSSPTENELRLCYSGHTVKRSLAGNPLYKALLEFGEYSSQFSFLQGHGLPGRVFNLGIPNWEQRVDHAPPGHFERCGGANLYGIKTVLGLPVESPSVGRIVLALYSCDDITKDHNMVNKICSDVSKWNPLPRWKLVVDVSPEAHNEVLENMNSWDNTGNMSAKSNSNQSNRNTAEARNMNSIQSETATSRLHTELENSIDEEQAILKILAEYMPMDAEACLPGFMTLRLLLLRPPTRRNISEAELLRTVKGSYKSYKAVGRKDIDIAQLLAKDCMFLSQSDKPSSSNTLSSYNHAEISPRLRNVSFSSAASISPHSALSMREPNQQQAPPPKILPSLDNNSNAMLVDS